MQLSDQRVIALPPTAQQRAHGRSERFHVALWGRCPQIRLHAGVSLCRAVHKRCDNIVVVDAKAAEPHSVVCRCQIQLRDWCATPRVRGHCSLWRAVSRRWNDQWHNSHIMIY